MPDADRTILICSCEGTMPLDGEAVRRGCRGSTVTAARQLCGAEIDRFRAITGEGAPLTVGCTQEVPRFIEAAAALGRTRPIQYVNIRETAGWSSDAAKAGPKMAALLAAANESLPDAPVVSLTSEGVILIYGRGEEAVEAGDLLKDHLDVTVMIRPPAAVAPQPVADFPVVMGAIGTATGHLGAFDVTVDAFAEAAPSSRGVLSFGRSRDGARSRCDIILDLSGEAALFAAPDLRDGYLRASPDNPAAMFKAILKARDLIGVFDKPRYVAFDPQLCAHSRSKIVGCTRCFEVCPAGAIAPAGEHVAIDANICAGCGECAAVCPSGAASYAVPPSDALMRKLRAMLIAYREARGDSAVVLIHDEEHGAPLIDALARFGDGLPAHVLPLAVNAVTQVGLEAVAAAFAYGASAMRLVLRARPRHDVTGLRKTVALAETVLGGLGFGLGRIATIETDDPDALGSMLRDIPPMPGAPRPASFIPIGAKPGLTRFALRELHLAAPEPVDVVALPEQAPFGSVNVDVAGCTLCLSCVSACPTGALRDDPDRPALSFVEQACIQCGLCKATCPEKVITLKPQFDFRASAASARLLNEEEPFSCIRCGKPFGVKGAIERVVAKLEHSHWMFAGSPGRLDLIKMCENCRVARVSEEGFDPYGSPGRSIRTTDDYLRERDEQERAKKGGS
jgi:ferredoxin